MSLRLIERRRLDDSTTHFVFEAPFVHEAGQYIALTADVAGEKQKRYYSIASAPRDDNRIELCIQTTGSFGHHLAQLHPGAEIDFEGPGGKMRLLDPNRPSVYVGAGTGISPLRAVLQQQLAANPEAQATLLFGARHSTGLFYADEFEGMAQAHANFDFEPTVSGADDPNWSGRRGRVFAHLAELLSDTADCDAYFCGHREMVDQLKADLAAAGVPDEHQVYERY